MNSCSKIGMAAIILSALFFTTSAHSQELRKVRVGIPTAYQELQARGWKPE